LEFRERVEYDAAARRFLAMLSRLVTAAFVMCFAAFAVIAALIVTGKLTPR
jgi:hypothetical protein